jgi:murein L,D-transpeptidase YafK
MQDSTGLGPSDVPAWLARLAMTLIMAAGALSLLAPTALRADNPLPVADKVIVEKSQRRLRLVRDGEVLREFPISLGFEPVGDKVREGDNRTPEGSYLLDHRNVDSDYFLSIRISYPSPRDIRESQMRGEPPGGQIMIHGQPNEPKFSPGYYASADWTNGCIAVSNAAMIDIWLMTAPNTPIEIHP